MNIVADLIGCDSVPSANAAPWQCCTVAMMPLPQCPYGKRLLCAAKLHMHGGEGSRCVEHLCALSITQARRICLRYAVRLRRHRCRAKGRDRVISVQLRCWASCLYVVFPILRAVKQFVCMDQEVRVAPCPPLRGAIPTAAQLSMPGKIFAGGKSCPMEMKILKRAMEYFSMHGSFHAPVWLPHLRTLNHAVYSITYRNPVPICAEALCRIPS